MGKLCLSGASCWIPVTVHFHFELLVYILAGGLVLQSYGLLAWFHIWWILGHIPLYQLVFIITIALYLINSSTSEALT